MNRTRTTVVILIVALGAMFIVRGVLPNVNPKRFGVVDEGTIYRSGRLTPEAMRKVIEENGIRTVVDLGADPRGSRGERLQQRTADALGVERHRLDLIGDATGDPNDYVEALRLINDPANQPVLVHCGAGAERTGCLVALHRQIVQGQTLDDALAETREYGHSPRRNPHLEKMLETWQARITESYRSGVPIEPRMPPQPEETATTEPGDAG